ncbi:MAG: peptidoglycan editing factor PgeF [Candidatus Aminicenantes bacterium]|nr:peptidoglycan editing factor PgeF [Candidatus Aminicenantes bacterium]
MLFLTDPRLSRVPGLIHGFGRRGFTENGLFDFARERGLRPVLLDQIHSDLIHIIEKEPSSRPSGDALMTRTPGLLLVIKTADCLPLLLWDRRLRLAAAVHAGWKGTCLRIVRKTVEAMRSRFGTDPADIVAAAGPCIGPACYEVGMDVREVFLSAGFSELLFVPAGRPGKYFLDLPGANARELEEAGVAPPPPTLPSSCTHCDPNSHSWRRDGDPTRRMFSFIGLQP